MLIKLEDEHHHFNSYLKSIIADAGCCVYVTGVFNCELCYIVIV